MRTTVVLALLSFGVLLPRFASAGPLAPSKASDLRTVFGQAPGTPCPGAASFITVDTQQNSNGTTSPFSIPAKSVFIVTSVDVQAPNGAGFAAEALFLVSDGTGDFAQVATCGAIAGSGNVAVASCDLGTGFAVKSGATLCFAGGRAIVRGFIAKDK